MRLISKFSNRYTLLILATIYGIFAGYIMPKSIESAQGDGPLDLLFSYAPETAFAHVESYGEMGRAAYIKFSLIADTAYPVIYTLLFMVIISLLATKLWPARKGLQRLALVPLLALVFDLCENQNIVSMLKSWPETNEKTAQMASLFTSLKWTSIGVSFAVILVLLCLWILRAVRKS